MRTHPHLYEISVWPWLERLSRSEDRLVHLGNVAAATWDGFAEAGFDCIYLMGIWRRSAIGRLIARTDPVHLRNYDSVLPAWQMNDVPGSAFAIEAYEPDDRVGGWRGLDSCRAALAERGIDLLLDFVPNHTGFDHAWISENPEFYVQGTLADYRQEPDHYRAIESADGGEVRFFACGRDPFFAPWPDVAQLDYSNPATREAMIAVLQTIAQHCDGVRCDMAMLVLNAVFAQTWQQHLGATMPTNEFWSEATRRAPMCYLAEVYWDREFELQQQGFAFTYDKRLLDRLLEADADGVRSHLHADAAYNAKLARFLENHDEARSIRQFGGRIRAAATLALTLPGLRFFYDGQLDGADVRAPVQLGRWPDEMQRPAIRDFYERLLRTIDGPLFHDGEWTLLDVVSAGDSTNENIVAHGWRLGDELAVIAANLSASTAEGNVRIGALPDGDAFEFRDQLSGQNYRWTRDLLGNGLYVRLEGGDAHLFVVHRSVRGSNDA